MQTKKIVYSSMVVALLIQVVSIPSFAYAGRETSDSSARISSSNDRNVIWEDSNLRDTKGNFLRKDRYYSIEHKDVNDLEWIPDNDVVRLRVSLSSNNDSRNLKATRLDGYEWDIRAGRYTEKGWDFNNFSRSTRFVPVDYISRKLLNSLRVE